MDNELRKGGSKGPSSNESKEAHGSMGAQSRPAQSGGSTSGSGSVAQSADGLKDKASEVLGTVKEKAREVESGATEAYSRATKHARDGYERATTWASDRYDNAARSAKQAHGRSTSELERVRRNAEDLVTHNPVMISVAGLAAGLLIGALLPRTQRENEAFGRLSDELWEQGKRQAAELVRQGKDRVVEALDPDAGQTRNQPGQQAPHR